MNEEGIVQEDYEDYFMQQSYGGKGNLLAYPTQKRQFFCQLAFLKNI